MWKRWSSKFPTSVTSEENKAKQQTPTAAEPALDQGPSRSLSIDLKDANTNGTILDTVLDAQEQADKAEVLNIPAQVPVLQKLADNMVKRSTGPLRLGETSSTELENAHVLPETTTSPSGTPRADHGDHHSPSLKLSPVRVGEIPSVNSVDVSDTPAFGNTLSPPGSESPNLSTRARRLSFRSFAFFYGSDRQSPSIPKTQTHEHSNSGAPAQPKPTRAQRQALSSAMALRMLMIGPGPSLSPSKTSVGLNKSKSHKLKSAVSPPSPDLKKVKTKLLKPESANAIISQLRSLPLPDGPSFHVNDRSSSESLVTHPDAGGAPIHAVCLACTDEEAENKHFSRLRTGHNLSPPSSLTPNALPRDSSSSVCPNISTASLESLIPVLRDLHLISLLASPDLGFGQPVSGGEDSGILTGSVPSAATLVDGFEEITKQLMSLGFATSKAVAPSHVGIYPPTDRMSVLTYWWGLELVLPESSVVYLGKAKSISNTLLNFLSALAFFNNGVREALPFVRYIANFVDFEWSQIKAQDKGRGVVCAATWVMPAAMVPRPWDFASRPQTPPKSPNAPASPATPETSPTKGPDGTVTPTKPSLEHSQPPDNLYPVTPAMPLMPQLMVTPATLPRNFPVPQHAGV